MQPVQPAGVLEYRRHEAYSVVSVTYLALWSLCGDVFPAMIPL
jgi:hypothetical protein